MVGDIGAAATSTAGIIAHENVLKRLSMDPPAGQQAVPFGNWPTETFFGDKREFLFNGEAVQIIHEPDAHTDGDSIVFFRRSDVVATGDLFTTVMYPFIDTPMAARSTATSRHSTPSWTSPFRTTSTRAARWWCLATAGSPTSRT